MNTIIVQLPTCQGISACCTRLTKIEYGSPQVLARLRFDDTGMRGQSLQRLQRDLDIFSGNDRRHCRRPIAVCLIRWSADARRPCGLLLGRRAHVSVVALPLRHGRNPNKAPYCGMARFHGETVAFDAIIDAIIDGPRNLLHGRRPWCGGGIFLM